MCLAGHLQLESLPHPVVVHLLPFFKLLASFMRDCTCETDALSDKHYWMVKFSIDQPPLKMFLTNRIYFVKNINKMWERQCTYFVNHTPSLYLRTRKKKASEASAKHAGVGGGVCERSEQGEEEEESVPNPCPVKSSVLHWSPVLSRFSLHPSWHKQIKAASSKCAVLLVVFLPIRLIQSWPRIF